MQLEGKRMGVLVEDLYEDLEMWVPVMRLREAGAHVDLIGTRDGETYHGKHGVPATADLAAERARAEDYDGLVIPGGYAPDRLRRDTAVLDLVRSVDRNGGIVAMICHAGWVPISAGIVSGKQVTSTRAIKDDLVNAGALWADREVVRDGTLISSRSPADLPAFCREIVNMLAEAEGVRAVNHRRGERKTEPREEPSHES